MLKRLLGPILFLSVYIAASPAPPSSAEIDSIVAQLSEVTGFKHSRPIRVEIMGRDGWKAWIDAQIRENVKPEEIRAEELALKKFGLIPRGYDLRAATVDLLGEQAAAVYDHRGKRLLLVQETAEMMGEIVLVHELAHALADQNFDLTRFLESPKSDEAQLARLAVVEGQATWLMLDAQLKKMGMSLQSNSAALGMMASAGTNLAAGMFPVFEKAPLYMRETLMFPYSAGVLFQQAAIDRLGKQAFAEVMRRPPATAREVLHPEVWLTGWKPEPSPLMKFPGQEAYKVTTEGAVGELDWRILFEQYTDADEARSIAPAWRGGRFDLLETAGRNRAVLRFSAVWADEETSKRFMRLYKRVLEGKLAGHRPLSSDDNELRGSSAEGRYVIRRQGRIVQGIEGLDENSRQTKP